MGTLFVAKISVTYVLLYWLQEFQLLIEVVRNNSLCAQIFKHCKLPYVTIELAAVEIADAETLWLRELQRDTRAKRFSIMETTV